jgi:hemoglobin/transferrin/lactoferrin receptor protein
MRFLPSTVSDALRTVPGVYLSKTGPWASRIFMRGLGGDRVVVLMDGLRLNTVRGHGAQSSSNPVEWLQGVELMPGASSTLYGSDALAGVVNLVSHRSLFSESPSSAITLSADTGEPGGLRSQNLRTAFMTRGFGIELRGNLRNVESLHTPRGEVANSGDRGQNCSGRAALALGSTVMDYEHLHMNALDIGLPAFSSDQGSIGSYPVQGRETDRFELTRPGSGWTPELRLLAGQQSIRAYFNETTVTPRFVRGNYVGSTTNDATDRVRTVARVLQPSLRFRGPVDVRVIGELRREQARGPRLTHVTVRDRNGAIASETDQVGESVPSARRDAYAVGALVSDTLLTVRIEGGVRWDALRSRSDSSAISVTSRLDVRDERVSSEGGFSRRIGWLTPYGRAASGFRAPNLEERYYNNDIHGGMRLFGNPDLVAERSTTYELGLRLAEGVSETLTGLRVSAYRSDVDDLISYHYIDMLYGQPLFQYRNVRRARIEGLEAELKLRHGGHGMTLSGSFPRGEDRETGERLTDLGTARAALDLAASVPWMLPNGRMATRLLWSDAVRSSDATLARPAFTVVSAEISAVYAGVRGVLVIENLTNHSYREPVSFIESPGRQFTFALRRDFNFRLSGKETRL